MNCFECDKAVIIKEYRAFKYNNVGLNNLCLLNVDVEVCSTCDTETPLLQNVVKLHNAIGIAVAIQRVQLSGADIRYLRRSSGFSVGDWAKRLNVAEGTYSKWENNHRLITTQADKLARINFLNAIKQKDTKNIHIARHLETVLGMTPEPRREFIIAVDAKNPDAEPRYLPHDTPLLIQPKASFVEAKTMPPEPLATVVIVSGHPVAMPAPIEASTVSGETSNVSNAFALAA
jgi:DNA-binding transcriptional regulator YiaG